MNPEPRTPATKVSLKGVIGVIVKNTSTIDYMLPIFRGLRQKFPEIELSIFYATPSRKKILRKSRFYDRFFREVGVKQYDMLDSTSRRVRIFAPLLRSFLRFNNWDVVPGNRPSLGNLLLKLVKKIEWMVMVRFSARRFFSEHPAEAVLFDNRTLTGFKGRDEMYTFLKNMEGKILLLPHAPHNTSPNEFTPFDAEKQVAMYDNCEYWMTLKQERAYDSAPEFKNQFHHVGYPGLDTEWLSWLSRFNVSAARLKKNRPLRVLYITRSFSGELSGREQFEKKPDPFVLTSEEFEYNARLIHESLAACKERTSVIVKPHPANNFRTLNSTFNRIGIEGWQISYEPIYEFVGNIDLVIGLYSTALCIPILSGVPTIVLNSRTQECAHQWSVVREMYSGLKYFLNDPEDLRSVVPAVVSEPGQSASQWAQSDADHLRDFFPDHALDLSLNRLEMKATT